MKKIISLLSACAFLSMPTVSILSCANHPSPTVNKIDLKDVTIDKALCYLPVYRFESFNLLGVYNNYLMNENSKFQGVQYGKDYFVQYYKTITDAQNNQNVISQFPDLLSLGDNNSVYIKFIASANSQLVKNVSSIFTFVLQTIDNRLDLINFRTFWKDSPQVAVNIKKGEQVTIAMLKQAAISSILDVMYNGLYADLSSKYDVDVNLFTDADRGTFLTDQIAETKPTQLGVEFYAKDFSLKVINYSICDGFMPTFVYSDLNL